MEAVGAVLLLNRIKRPGSLLLVLILCCLLSETSPGFKFSLFYTQPSVSTHVLQVEDWCLVQNQRLSDFRVIYGVRSQAFMAARTSPSPSPYSKYKSALLEAWQRGNELSFFIFCFVMSRVQISSKQCDKWFCSLLGADEIQLCCYPQVSVGTGERRYLLILAFIREKNMNTFIGPWKSYLY